MSELENYNKTKLHPYQQLINKFMYLAYGMRLDIAFVVGQLSRPNTVVRIEHL